METINLGRSGLKVSRLCLGCMTYGQADPKKYPHAGWTLDEAASRPFIKQALEQGINFFDTADMYGFGSSEEVLGRAIRDFSARDELVVATKVWAPIGNGPNGKGLSRKHIMDAIDGSLKRLGTDYVDLYQIHRWDYDTPIEETMEALHDVVKAGKVRYLGASSMYAWQFSKAQYTATLNNWTPFISMQPQYNLVNREEEREMLPLCEDMGVGVIPWSPLARGFLAGNRSGSGGATDRAKTDQLAQGMYYQPEDFAIVDRLASVAKARGVPVMQVALAWVLSKPSVTAPIIGASKPGHLEDAIAALDIRLSDAEISLLEELYKPHSVVGFQ